VNWVGNRLWTFSANRQDRTVREGLEFFAVSIAGMGIGLGCLWVSHYVLGYTSVLADNISGNVIGLALGAVFRFSLYRWWVFAPHRNGAAGSAVPARTVPVSVGVSAGVGASAASASTTPAVAAKVASADSLASVRD